MKCQSNRLLSLWEACDCDCECECLSFRLCNAPATFQRLIQNCLGELNLTYCLIGLDNIIVFTKTEEEHLKHLCIVFDCFWEHNLRPKPTKCEFLQDEINYLAHNVSKKGMWPSKESKSSGGVCSTPNLH